MAPETLQPGAIGAESSRTTGASTNAPPGGTQRQRRHQLFRRDAAIVAIDIMTQDSQFKIVCKTGRSKNMEQHAIGSVSIHIDVEDG